MLYILCAWIIAGIIGYLSLLFLERKKGYQNNYYFDKGIVDLKLTQPFSIKILVSFCVAGPVSLFIYLRFRWIYRRPMTSQ
jgi:hypothetical protein